VPASIHQEKALKNVATWFSTAQSRSTTSTGNTPEAPELGTPRYKGNFFGSEQCAIEGFFCSPVHCSPARDNILGFKGWLAPVVRHGQWPGRRGLLLWWAQKKLCCRIVLITCSVNKINCHQVATHAWMKSTLRSQLETRQVRSWLPHFWYHWNPLCPSTDLGKK